ncbi:hypothetical protein M3Y95_00645900 [Aphelenchoides besseyi]|nr:hypothetical protein M3Y95_00645900 [Aphelenchoides besseyi]
MEAKSEESLHRPPKRTRAGKESVIYGILHEDFEIDDSFLDAFASIGLVGQQIQSHLRRGSAQRGPFSVIWRTKEKLGASMKYTVLNVIEVIPEHKRLQGENILLGLFDKLYEEPNSQLANWVRSSDERDGEIVLLSGKSDRRPIYIQDDADIDSSIASYLLLYGLIRADYHKFNYNFTRGSLKTALKKVEEKEERLTQELAQSRRSINEVLIDNNQLLMDNIDLRDENEMLRRENGTLREENETHRVENGTQQVEIGSLREENETLKLEVAGLKAQLARALARQ